MRIEGRVDGDAVKALQDLAKRASDLTPVWEQVADIWDERQKALFRPGSRLAPLDPKTVRNKGTSVPLVETGRLRKATIARQPVKATEDSVTFGIAKGDKVRPIAILQRTGRKNMPKRDPVPRLTAAETKRVLGLLREHLMGDDA